MCACAIAKCLLEMLFLNADMNSQPSKTQQLLPGFSFEGGGGIGLNSHPPPHFEDQSPTTKITYPQLKNVCCTSHLSSEFDLIFI